MIRLEFDRGSLLVHGVPEGFSLPGCLEDERVGALRARAHQYRDLVNALRQRGWAYEDDARRYETLALSSHTLREPFPHQTAALEAWTTQGRRGVVVLPTGAGKTFVAQLAIERTARSTLVVTPTLDLVQQWHGILVRHFGCEVGIIGGGEFRVLPLTVTTYDSAWMHMEHLGHRFAFLVFDECHHLPGPSYSQAAELSLAPFRLGLTATPEREDRGERRYGELIGPIVHRDEIRELAGTYLAEYQTVELRVALSEMERANYARARAVYIDFLRLERINMGDRRGWTRFLIAASRSPEGRRALLAHREQKRIAQASEGKLEALRQLLVRHRSDRALIFTSDNETVHRIARRFLIPAITHETKIAERQEILAGFNEGIYPFLVTSKVLNEGVDVPSANVGIVLSGSGSVREHVQRLGRILRRSEGKRAILYEVVADDTAEESTSQRRRQHSAYDGLDDAVRDVEEAVEPDETTESLDVENPPC